MEQNNQNQPYDKRGLDFLNPTFECNIEYEGLTFKSAEHLYNWLRVEDGEDWWKEKIQTAPHGLVAKKLANNAKCKKKDGDGQREFMIDIMKKCIFLKFTQNPQLMQQLINIPDDQMTNYIFWDDSFWGINIKTNVGSDELGNLYRQFANGARRQS